MQERPAEATPDRHLRLVPPVEVLPDHSLEGLDLRTEKSGFLQISGDLDLDCIPFGGLGDCGPWTGLPVHSSYLRLCHSDMRAILT